MLKFSPKIRLGMLINKKTCNISIEFGNFMLITNNINTEVYRVFIGNG